MYRITIIILLFATQLGATIESVKSGKWGVASTWSAGVVPNAQDTVLIGKNNQVSLSQVNNLCAVMKVKGSVHCSSPGRTLKCRIIYLLDSGRLSSNVLGTINVDTVIVKGTNIIEGFNLQVSELFDVNNNIYFNRTSGKIEIKNLLIAKGASWNASQNQSFWISGWFENNGQFNSGTGKYNFSGINVLRGSNEISIHHLRFNNTLINKQILQVGESIVAPDSAVFINDSTGKFIIKTTDANIGVKQLNFTAPGNSLVMSRGTRQTLPISINNEYQQISITGGGELVVDSAIHLKQQLMIDSSSTLSLNNTITVSGNSSLVINRNAILKIKNKSLTGFSDFSSSFGSSQLDSTSSINIFSDFDFKLPVLDYGSLKISSNVMIKVLNQGNQKFRGYLEVGQKTDFVLNQQNLTIKGSGLGTGKFVMTNSSVNYCGQAGQKILPCDYDTLIVENSSLDTSSALGTFKVNKLFVKRGVVKLGSLSISSLVVDSLSEVLLGSGLFEIATSLVNKGKFTITSNTSHCTFNGILSNTGSFSNNSSSNHTLNADLTNSGVFKGCFGTACTWEIQNNIKVKGSRSICLPRIKSNGTDTIFNAGHLKISSSIKGNGALVNQSKSVLMLGMHSTQNEFSLNAWEFPSNTVVFERVGDQLIHVVDSSIFQNLHLSKPGIKRMPGNLYVLENITVDTNATFNVDSNKLTVSSNSSLHLKPNSMMVLGNSLSDHPTIFPTNFLKKRMFVDKTSTISYESSGDQVISTIPQYGNLLIKDGAVTRSTKSIGVGDSLVVHGLLKLTESSIKLVANNKVVEIHGDWEGPGNVFFNKGELWFYGNANSTGKLDLGVAPVHYVGVGDQHMKNTNYHNLYINKLSGTATVDAGPGIFLVKNNMYINRGKVRVNGEQFEVQDSLVISDTLFFKSRAQSKLLNNVSVLSSGILDNTYGIDLAVGGNVLVNGVWKNGNKSTVNFNNSNNQSVTNTGQVSFHKLILSSDSLKKIVTIIGDVQINDSVVLKKSTLNLKSACVLMSNNAVLIGESENNQVLGTITSIIKAQVRLDSTKNENIAGLGYSVYSNTAMGSGVLTRGFDDNSLPAGELSIKKSYLLELTDSSQIPYQCTMNYNNYELLSHDESLLTIYYDNNYSNIYRVGLSSLHSQFNTVSYLGVKTGTKVTLGHLNPNPLPVNLLSFSVSLNYTQNGTETANLSWIVGSEINTKKYLLQVSENGQNFNLLTEVNWKKSNSSANKYTYDYPIKSNSNFLYYQLYEKDVFDVIRYLGVVSVQRRVVTSVAIINGQAIKLNTIPYSSSLTLYTLDGREIGTSSNMNFTTKENFSGKICVICSSNHNKRYCEKMYLK